MHTHIEMIVEEPSAFLPDVDITLDDKDEMQNHATSDGRCGAGGCGKLNIMCESHHRAEKSGGGAGRESRGECA